VGGRWRCRHFHVLIQGIPFCQLEVTATRYDCNPVGISINCSCGSWQVLALSRTATFLCAWIRGHRLFWLAQS
jgi:hypothetical protein